MASSPATPAAAAPAAPAPAAAPAAPTFKVFVGNLSFKTREAALQQAFAPAGNVLSANIITRGPRSLGYGFVEFLSEAEARKAVQLLNKKELDGREVNVEVAKTRDDEPAAPPAAAADGAPAYRGRGRARPRGESRGGAGTTGAVLRRRGGAGPGAARDGAPAPASGAPAGGAPAGGYPPRGAYRGGRGGRGGGRPPRAAGAEADAGAAPRATSATTLFVANLPFSVDDKELHALFAAFNPVAAHVVVKRNGRSKGFGFVEFKTQDDQTRALAALDKKDVSGRELIVKIALTETAESGAPAAPAPAPVAAAPAAAAPAASSPATKPAAAGSPAPKPATPKPDAPASPAPAKP